MRLLAASLLAILCVAVVRGLRPAGGKRIRMQPSSYMDHMKDKGQSELRTRRSALELQGQAGTIGAENVEKLDGKPCTFCRRKGTCNCGDCRGSGKVGIEGRLKYCSSCRGNGKFICPRCHGKGSVASWMAD